MSFLYYILLLFPIYISLCLMSDLIVWLLLKAVRFEEGEVSVSGESELLIEVGFPIKSVEIYFVDPCPPKTGCNQSSEDNVSCVIYDDSFIIYYNTSEVRVVHWIAEKE